MATDTASQTDRIKILVGEPYGSEVLEQWWSLTRLATALEDSTVTKTLTVQMRVLVNVPHGDHAHEQWWSINELAVQRAAISAGNVKTVPAVLASTPHGDHAHEQWLPLDQLFERIGHEHQSRGKR